MCSTRRAGIAAPPRRVQQQLATCTTSAAAAWLAAAFAEGGEGDGAWLETPPQWAVLFNAVAEAAHAPPSAVPPFTLAAQRSRAAWQLALRGGEPACVPCTEEFFAGHVGAATDACDEPPETPDAALPLAAALVQAHSRSLRGTPLAPRLPLRLETEEGPPRGLCTTLRQHGFFGAAEGPGVALLEGPGCLAATLQSAMRLGLKVCAYYSLEQDPERRRAVSSLVGRLAAAQPHLLTLGSAPRPVWLAAERAPPPTVAGMHTQLQQLPTRHGWQWWVAAAWGPGLPWGEADVLQLVGGLQLVLQRRSQPALAYLLVGPKTTEEQQQQLGLPFGAPVLLDQVQAGAAEHRRVAVYTNLAAAEHLSLVCEHLRPLHERRLARLISPDRLPPVAQQAVPLGFAALHVPGQRMAALLPPEPAAGPTAALRTQHGEQPVPPTALEWTAIQDHHPALAEVDIPLERFERWLRAAPSPAVTTSVVAQALTLRRAYHTPHDPHQKPPTIARAAEALGGVEAAAAATTAAAAQPAAPQHARAGDPIKTTHQAAHPALFTTSTKPTGGGQGASALSPPPPSRPARQPSPMPHAEPHLHALLPDAALCALLYEADAPAATELALQILRAELPSEECLALLVLQPEAAELEEEAASTGQRDVWLDTPFLQALKQGRVQRSDRRLARRAASYRWDGTQLHRLLPDGSIRLCPPPSQRPELIMSVHRNTGHLGIKRTMALLRVGHWWYGMRRHIEEALARCAACSLSNACGPARPVELNPLPVRGLFYRWGVDLAGPLVPSHIAGNTYCMVAIEHFTKWVEIVPIKEKSAAHTARAFADILARYGAPAEVLTDNGTEWEGEFADLLERAMIDPRKTSAAHPQSDGAAERVVQVLKEALRKACHEAADAAAWEAAVPELLLGYRCSPQASTRFSPYELLYGGIQPVLPSAVRERLEPPLDLLGPSPEEAAASVQERADWVAHHWPEAASNLLIAQQRDTLRYSAARTGRYLAVRPELKPGDYVYVRRGNIANTLQMRTYEAILRVVSVGPLGVAVLIGRDGARTRRHVDELLVCHAPVDPIIDPSLFRPARDMQCQVCHSPRGATSMLLCDGCNSGWHYDCLGLSHIPDGDWLCPECRSLPDQQLAPGATEEQPLGGGRPRAPDGQPRRPAAARSRLWGGSEPP